MSHTVKNMKLSSTIRQRTQHGWETLRPSLHSTRNDTHEHKREETQQHDTTQRKKNNRREEKEIPTDDTATHICSFPCCDRLSLLFVHTSFSPPSSLLLARLSHCCRRCHSSLTDPFPSCARQTTDRIASLLCLCRTNGHGINSARVFSSRESPVH